MPLYRVHDAAKKKSHALPVKAYQGCRVDGALDTHRRTKQLAFIMRMKMSTTRSIFRLLLMLTWYLAMSMTRMQCHREQPPDLVDVEPIGSRPATRHGEAATTQLKEGLTKASDLGMQAAEAAMDRGKETWNALKDRANHMKDTAKNSLAEKAESIR